MLGWGGAGRGLPVGMAVVSSLGVVTAFGAELGVGTVSGVLTGVEVGGGVVLGVMTTAGVGTIVRVTVGVGVMSRGAIVAVEAMTLGGVFERCPKLKVAFRDGNGSWLSFCLWRLDEVYDYTVKYECPELKLKPSEYFYRQCFVSCNCDDKPVK